jgi:hypothetical protein
MAKRKPCRVREFCQGGALLQAARDIFRNFPTSKIPDYLRRRYTYMTDEEAQQIVALAQRSVLAGILLQVLPQGERLAPGWIPKLPE